MKTAVTRPQHQTKTYLLGYNGYCCMENVGCVTFFCLIQFPVVVFMALMPFFFWRFTGSYCTTLIFLSIVAAIRLFMRLDK